MIATRPESKYTGAPAWLIFVGFLLLYALVPNNDQGYDSYSFALAVKNGTDLFHPHHLIYGLFGLVLRRLFSSAGIESLRLLSLANALFGAISVLLIYRLVARLTDRRPAAAAALFAGLMFSFWHYSTSAEVNMPAIMFLLLGIYYLKARPTGNLAGLAGYFFLVIGALFHQVVALAIIPAIIYDAVRRRSLRRALAVSTPFLGLGIAAYVIVGLTQAADRSLGGLYRWITLYGHLGAWGNLESTNIRAGAWGVMKTVFGGDTIRQLYYSGQTSVVTVVWLAVAGLVAVGLVWLLAVALKNLITAPDATSGLCFILALVFGFFALWWDPGNDGFWLYTAVLLVIFSFRPAFSGIPRPSVLRRRVLPAIIFLTAILNLSWEFVPAAAKGTSLSHQGVEAFRRLDLSSSDLVLTSYPQIRIAYEYYYGVYVPTASVLFLPQGYKEEIVAEYRQQIDAALKTGRIIAFEDEIWPQPYRYYLFSRFTPEEYTEIYRPYLDYLVTVDSISVHGSRDRLFEIAVPPEEPQPNDIIYPLGIESDTLRPDNGLGH